MSPGLGGSAVHPQCFVILPGRKSLTFSRNCPGTGKKPTNRSRYSLCYPHITPSSLTSATWWMNSQSQDHWHDFAFGSETSNGNPKAIFCAEDGHFGSWLDMAGVEFLKKLANTSTWRFRVAVVALLVHKIFWPILESAFGSGHCLNKAYQTVPGTSNNLAAILPGACRRIRCWSGQA